VAAEKKLRRAALDQFAEVLGRFLVALLNWVDVQLLVLAGRSLHRDACAPWRVERGPLL